MNPESMVAPIDESASMFLYSHSEVDQELSYLSAFEDEAPGLQDYLPECNVDHFDGIVDFGTSSSVKGFNIESLSCAFNYDQIKFDGDALDLYLAQEAEETKGNGKRLLVANDKALIGDFTLRSTCKETIMGKTSKIDEGRAVHLTSAALSDIAPVSTDKLDDQIMSGEKHVNREKLTGCNSLKSISSPLRDVGFCSLDESSTVDILVRRKRTQRSTKAHTEILEQHESRNPNKKCVALYKNPRDELLLVRSQIQHHEKRLGSEMISQENSLRGSCMQGIFNLPVQIGQLTKSSSSVDDFKNCDDGELSVSDDDFNRETSSADSLDDISEADCVTRRKRVRKRRQRHSRWTPCEVMKLIEGVSKFGVGKWTHIKKSLFSCSSQRTSVNLKDKWRNLLKASSNEAQKKRKVEQEHTHASQHQLPESVWRQVRELAIIYSYPRANKSKDNLSTPSKYC